METVMEEPGPPQHVPFKLSNDELQAEDAVQSEAWRLEAQHLPIHLKTTLASRMHALVDTESGPSTFNLLPRGAAAAAAAFAIARPAVDEALPSDHARRKGDNVRDLLVKKRQIFLVQMSLDIKRSEISKLEQHARQREEALTASEAALEADAKRFDDFLKDNDRRLQEALARAESLAKARQDKSGEAKRLAAVIAHTRSEIGKAEEALAEALRCKEFLDRVVPREHFEALAVKRAAAREALHRAWVDACTVVAGRRDTAASAKAAADHDMHWARTQQQFEKAERACRDATRELEEALALPEPPAPDFRAQESQAKGVYFTDPAQLLAVFSQLEERNMFMIQAAQDAEQAVEVGRAERERAEATLGANAAALQAQVDVLQVSIAAAKARCKRLQQVAQHNEAVAGGHSTPGSAPDLEDSEALGGGASTDVACSSLKAPVASQLLDKLGAAYEAAGFARDASLTPLVMLAQIESRLEESIAAVEAGLPAVAAEQTEKAREKQRRQAVRQERIAAQQAEHEARIQRVLERAAAPAFRRVTTVQMVRSVLQLRQKSEPDEQREDDAEQELQAYLALEHGA